MKAMHFGAGNIGRGFIGQILKGNNYEITFVDVNDTLIDEIKNKGCYTIKILNKDKDEIKINDIKGLNSSTQLQDVINLIAEVDLITTSLGQDNLKYIVNTIVEGINLRKENNNTNKLDIIACENGVKVSSILKTLVVEKLNDTDTFFIDNIAFVDSAVDRIVPNQINENILDVQVEEAYEWVVDQNQIKQNFKLQNVVYTKDLLFFNKRKLLTVNFAHAYIGYMGYAKGYTYVSEALKDNQILKSVKEALINIKDSLKYDFKFDDQEQNKYIEKTIKRFQNELIVDELTRVARNPKTKLSKEERFISPLLKLTDNGKEAKGLICGVAYALKYDFKNDQQAMQIQSIIKECGIKQAIKEITEVENDELINKIIMAYENI